MKMIRVSPILLLLPVLAFSQKTPILFQHVRVFDGNQVIPSADVLIENGVIRAAGVPILAGTVAPNPGTTYGASLHGELELYVEAGFTPIQALVAATSAPAAAFHIPDRGRIALGLRADLLLVSGHPDENILATRNIVAVYNAGNEVDRHAYVHGK